MEKFYQVGLDYENNQNWDEALRCYTKCLEVEPDHIQARIHLGQVYIKIDELDKALLEFKKVLEKKSKEGEAYSGTGQVYFAQGKVDLAKEIFMEILQENDKNLQANVGLGWVYLKEKQFDKAERYFKQAVELDSSCTQAHLGLGQIYLEKNQLNLALKELKFTSNLQSSSPYAYLGRYYLEKGKYYLSQEWYKKAVQIKPDDFYNRWGLLMSYFFQKKCKGTLLELDKIRKFDLKNIHVNLGEFVDAIEHYSNNRYDQAIDVLRQITNISPQEVPDRHFLLGKFYQAKGDLNLAREEYLRAIEVFPNFIHAKLALEEISLRV